MRSSWPRSTLIWRPTVMQSARYRSSQLSHCPGKSRFSLSRAASRAAAISARRGAFPSAWAREMATGATSGPKSSSVWVRFTPMPATT